MSMTLARRWWTLALRGAAAILFGILTFISPGPSLFVMVLLFGAYALADGVLNLVLAIESRRGTRRTATSWGWLVAAGLMSIAAGVVTFAWPGMTAVLLLLFIAWWCVLRGIAEVAAAIRLRKSIRGEWLLGLSGVLSVLFGALLLLRPGAGALALALWIGAYAIVFGALLVGLSFRLRAWQRGQERRVPPGGLPTAA
jgi:uncharacterized membrane protein HdeD (DUF308 family)